MSPSNQAGPGRSWLDRGRGAGVVGDSHRAQPQFWIRLRNIKSLGPPRPVIPPTESMARPERGCWPQLAPVHEVIVGPSGIREVGFFVTWETIRSSRAVPLAVPVAALP